MATAKHNRGDYHKQYYARNRAARLAYQRAYDAEHKPEKAKRMKAYRHDRRHGYHLAALSGIPGFPVLTEEEKDRRIKNRAYVLAKDTEYRCAAFHRKWAEENPEEAAAADAQFERWRKLMETWDWETQGMAPGVLDC
jgi:hypothetical protein